MAASQDSCVLPPVVMPDVPIHQMLKGQKALVTGANSGIGKAVAIALGQAGADVVVNFVRGDEAAQAVADEAAKLGSTAYIHNADVSKEDQVIAMFDKMKSTFGTIDILVNNAGPAAGCGLHRHDARPVAEGDRRQPHRAVPVRPRSRP